MRIAIVDDSRQDRNELTKLLSQQLEFHCIHGEILEYDSGLNFLKEFTPGRFQVLFLDIYLISENGMDVARTVRNADPDCRLVFFTSSYDHAVASYEVRASYYLTKPLDPSRLQDALTVCLSGISKDSRYLDVSVKGGLLRLAMKEIFYVDCERRIVRIHTKDKLLEVSDSLSHILGALSTDERFLNCNRGLLVNMDHIHQTKEGEFVLYNGERIPLRVRGRGELKKAYLAYSLKGLRRGEHS